MTLIGSFSGILEADIEQATWSDSGKERFRDHAYRVATLVLARLLLPFAAVVSGRRARQRASEWALSLRFPREQLGGLTESTRDALIEARTVAFWRYGELIGVTSGKRTERAQQRLFDAAIQRYGSVRAAQRWVLPPHESAHVLGTAMDLRPYAGARWLDRHGPSFGLYRTFDNEWWHFEYLDDVAYESLAS